MEESTTQKCSFVIRSNRHSRHTTIGLCNLMEHQSLVDVLLCCGSNCIHAHKIVLACHSKLLRAEFEQNANVEQVIFTGCDFKIIKSLVKFIYDGETCVSEANASNFIAMARMLQIDSLDTPLDYEFSDSLIVVPKPIFITTKPKYPTFPCKSANSAVSILKPTNCSITNSNPAPKNRKLYVDAEHQACVKEAMASKLALANLKKELSTAPQPPVFIIEDSYTETTVENFIPSDGKNFVSLEVDNLAANVKCEKDAAYKSEVMVNVQNGEQRWTANKIRQVLENRANSNVEVMFKTADGSFVTVTDEVLRNLQKEGLQYQVIDEDGKLGELQELNCFRTESEEQSQDSICDMEFEHSYAANSDSTPLDTSRLKSEDNIVIEAEPPTLFKTLNLSDYLQPLSKKEEEEEHLSPVEDILKFNPEMFFSDFGEPLQP